MRFDIITLFPELFASTFSAGVVKKAMDKELIEIGIHDLRAYTRDKHRQVDDRPFGGSPGMVLKPEPIYAAVEAVRSAAETPVYLLSPQGRVFDSEWARSLAEQAQVVLVCGRYEGVDERVVEHLVTDEISIGDYVLTGGELAAMVVVDAISRYVPDVVGRSESVRCESFAEGVLDFPHYTRPRSYRGLRVPEVLFSGDHARIAAWRRRKSLEKTLKNRPDLIAKREMSPEEKDIREKVNSEEERNDR